MALGKTGIILGGVVGLLAITLKLSTKHDEEALLADWSDPPPLFIFIGVNVLAGALRSFADALTPPPLRMMDVSMGYQTTMLAYMLSKFEIPEFLASGPKTVQEIALHMQTQDIGRVERLLYAAASEGMTSLDKMSPEKGNPRFVNTALSAVLRVDHPNSLKGFLGHWVEDSFMVWNELPQMFGPDAASCAWDLAWPEYPRAQGGIWSLYESDNVREEQFGRAMAGLEALGGKAMSADGPFSKFQRFVDVGGSTGHFLYRLLQDYPNQEGLVYDRENVIANTKKLWMEPGGIYHDGTQDRVSIVSGSFFDDNTLPEAKDGDVFYLRYILHDWNDAEAIKILVNIRKAMGSKNATLLIGECLIPERDTVGVIPAQYHIDMHMMAMFGDAVERTRTQWVKLFQQAGFELVGIYPTRSLVSWIEAVPLAT